eukprot:3039832-Pyramimonas_sp.AAC.1
MVRVGQSAAESVRVAELVRALSQSVRSQAALLRRTKAGTNMHARNSARTPWIGAWTIRCGAPSAAPWH